MNYFVGAGVGIVVSIGGVLEGTKGGKLQLAMLSTKTLSQPLTSQSCRWRSMPSEQRSAVEHQTQSKPMVFEIQESQELNATHVGSAVK